MFLSLADDDEHEYTAPAKSSNTVNSNTATRVISESGSEKLKEVINYILWRTSAIIKWQILPIK
jgi:hypothetical protein